MWKGKLVRMVDEDNGSEDELSLELSIGGNYGKQKQTRRIERKPVEVCVLVEEEDYGMEEASRREIPSLRRREARRKREEKIKKSLNLGSCVSVNGPFLENKEWLEGQIVEPALKKEKIETLAKNAFGSNASAQAVSPVKSMNGFVNKPVVWGGGRVVPGLIDEEKSEKKCGFFLRAAACRSFLPYEGDGKLKSNEDEMEGGGGTGNHKRSSSGSPGCSSSAFSNNQCSSGQGGSTTDDCRSNSSQSQLDQQLERLTSSAASDPQEQTEHTAGSSKLTGSTISTMPKSTDSSASKSTLVNPTEEPKSNCQPKPVLTDANRNPPPKPGPVNQQASFLAQMPCVSTTGNGPNGRTVNGFLYRYTKNEVSIVCVCHGSSFSPAEFVEHAGGVDIVHPLKHITIFPTAFGC